MTAEPSFDLPLRKKDHVLDADWSLLILVEVEKKWLNLNETLKNKSDQLDVD